MALADLDRNGSAEIVVVAHGGYVGVATALHVFQADGRSAQGGRSQSLPAGLLSETSTDGRDEVVVKGTGAPRFRRTARPCRALGR
jgi:hypothetical protein